MKLGVKTMAHMGLHVGSFQRTVVILVFHLRFNLCWGRIANWGHSSGSWAGQRRAAGASWIES